MAYILLKDLFSNIKLILENIIQIQRIYRELGSNSNIFNEFLILILFNHYSSIKLTEKQLISVRVIELLSCQSVASYLQLRNHWTLFKTIQKTFRNLFNDQIIAKVVYNSFLTFLCRQKFSFELITLNLEFEFTK